MKKTLLSLLLMFAVSIFSMAQTVVFSDNFDSYTAGSHLAQSNSAWTTWSNAPGGSEDGVISTAQAASAPNSLYISGSNDQVYPFGNYTTGHYVVSFNYFVPSTGNNGAYFNVQHVLLQEWAFACYFYGNGNGYLKVGNSTYNFAFPSDSWFPISFELDMDNDLVELTINNNIIHAWPFHYQEVDTSGTNQLAGINFYAGSANNNLPGSYYVDDFVVTEVSAALVGEFVVSPETLSVILNPEASATLNLNLSNPGTGATDYKIITTYDIPDPDTASVDVSELCWWQLGVFVVGFTNASQYDLAVGFPSDMLQEHIGKTLREITIPLNAEINNAKIRVYAMGNQLPLDGPGEMIYEQSFVPTIGWNNVVLDEPIVIDGGDLWIGVWIDQPDTVRPFMTDSLLRNNYSSWFKNENSNIWAPPQATGMYDICIGGWIDGTPISPWITVSPTEGSIAANGNQNVSVNVQSNDMELNETRNAKLHCYSTDENNREVIVPVTISTAEVSVNEHNQIEVSVYPNPATDFVQVTSDQIQRVEIYNMMGQMVFENTYCDNHVVISTNNFAPGSYSVIVHSNNQKITKQVIIR